MIESPDCEYFPRHGLHDASRSEGTIRRRGDGWQVSLFTGYDPLTGKRVYLTQTVPPEAEARKTLTRFRSSATSRRRLGAGSFD